MGCQIPTQHTPRAGWMGGQSPVRHSSAHAGGRASLQPGTSTPWGSTRASGSSPAQPGSAGEHHGPCLGSAAPQGAQAIDTR